jgi:hypothetical protein
MTDRPTWNPPDKMAAMLQPGEYSSYPQCSEPVQGVAGDPTGQIVAERTKQHGDFYDQSMLTQQLKAVAHNSKNWLRLNGMAREGIDMVLHKISRILVGDAAVKDHWDDIGGYARCVSDRIKTRGVWDSVNTAAAIERQNHVVSRERYTTKAVGAAADFDTTTMRVRTTENQQRAELFSAGGVAVEQYAVLWEKKRRTVLRHRFHRDDQVFELLLDVGLWVPRSDCVKV